MPSCAINCAFLHAEMHRRPDQFALTHAQLLCSLRAAVPHLQKALAEKATIDLKPFASNAQKKIAAVIADFQKNKDGIRLSAAISSLRRADIAFDSKTLRVIAEAEGTINVAVSKLSGL